MRDKGIRDGRGRGGGGWEGVFEITYKWDGIFNVVSRLIFMKKRPKKKLAPGKRARWTPTKLPRSNYYKIQLLDGVAVVVVVYEEGFNGSFTVRIIHTASDTWTCKLKTWRLCSSCNISDTRVFQRSGIYDAPKSGVLLTNHKALFKMRWNILSSVWYIFSNKTKATEKMEV